MFVSHIKKLILVAAAVMLPFQVMARTTFEQASALLQAARSGDENTVRTMVQSGVNVNYRDPSGMSLACTAIMNNDLRTAQLLQRYGADASRCDAEIRAYRRNNEDAGDVGLFSGLTSTQSTLLVAGAAGLGVGALAYLAGLYSSNNNNNPSGGGSNRPGGGVEPTPPTETITIPNAPINNGNALGFAGSAPNFNFMSANALATPLNLTYNGYIPIPTAISTTPYRTNYLLLNSAYDAMGRGYLGQATIRNSNNSVNITLPALSIGGVQATGGRPVNVALISGSGITRSGTITDSATTWSNNGANNGASLPDVVWLTCTASSGGNCTAWSANTANKFANVQVNYNASDIITSVNENTALNLQNPGSSVFNTTLTQSNFDSAFGGAGATAILEYNKYNLMSGLNTANVQTLFTNAYADPTTAAFEYLKFSKAANYYTFLVYYAQKIVGQGGVANAPYTNCGISFNGLGTSCAITNTLNNLTDEVTATAQFEWQKYNGTADLSKFTGYYTEMLFSTMGSISPSAGNLPDLITGQPIAMTGLAPGGTQLAASIAILYRTYKGTADFKDFLVFYIYSTGGTITGVEANCPPNDPSNANCVSINTSNPGSVALANTAWAQYALQQAELFDDTFLAKIIGGDFTNISDFSGYIPNGQMTVIKTGNGKDANGRPIDFMNFQAINTAMLGATGLNISIVANANSAPFSRRASTDTADAWAILTPAQQTIFLNLINQHYQATQQDFLDAGLTAADFAAYQGSGYIAPSAFASAVFSGCMLTAGGTVNCSTAPKVMMVFGAGDYYASQSPTTTLTATFENLAPKLYTNLNHLFMTSVAVMAANGTNNQNIDQPNPSAVNANNKIVLSQYVDENGDILRARACGRTAGRGTDTIDPWCFAAPGITSDQSVASLAGSVGVVNGAFNYMSMQQLFTLLAVTSDRMAMNASDLQSKYALPNDYQARVNAGEDYKSVFAEVFGYGLTNLNRATTPNSNVFVFAHGTGGVQQIFSSQGNAEWHRYAAPVNSGNIQRTALVPSSAFGAKLNGIDAPMFDMVESIDGEMSMPRIFTQSLEFQNTRNSIDLMEKFRNFGNDEMTTAYDANGITLAFKNDFNFADEGYMRELSFKFDGANSFANAGYKSNARDGFGMMGLASDTINSDAGLKSGKFRFGVGGFTGTIRVADNLDRNMIVAENPDLGKIYGYNAVAGWEGKEMSFGFAAGQTIESDTILGAYGAGLLELGGSHSEFIRANAGYNLMDGVKLSASAEVARTTPNNNSNFVMSEVSNFTSTAFAAELLAGKWSFGAALPLAVSSGHVKYLNVDMDYIEADHGYDLAVNASEREINMASREREVRLNAAYRMDLGIFTTANVGAIYRINPDNSAEFGNESILMFKLKHRLGI